jgi:excisionase family DNA binding protein
MAKLAAQLKAEKEGIEADLAANGLCTVRRAAQFLAVSRGKIYLMMADGSLPSVKLGKSRRIPKAAVLELARKSLVTAD